MGRFELESGWAFQTRAHEQTQTSPNRTLPRLIVTPPEVAVMLCISVSDGGVAGKVAVKMLSPTYVPTSAGTDFPPKETLTFAPSATKPQTTACDGADCSTMASECAFDQRKAGGAGGAAAAAAAKAPSEASMSMFWLFGPGVPRSSLQFEEQRAHRAAA